VVGTFVEEGWLSPEEGVDAKLLVIDVMSVGKTTAVLSPTSLQIPR
jgi:hypothetical protein